MTHVNVTLELAFLKTWRQLKRLGYVDYILGSTLTKWADNH